MGDMTRSEFRDALRFHLDNKQSLTTAELDRYIDMSYIHCCQPHLYQHREMLVETVAIGDGTNYHIDFTVSGETALESLANGTQYAAATTAGKFLSIQSITLIEGTDVLFPLGGTDTRIPLRPITRWEWESVQMPSGPVNPSAYSMWDRMFYLDKVLETDRTVLIRWWREPLVTEFDGDSETTVLPSMWDDTILVGAVWRGWRALGEFQKALLMKDEFLRLIREASQYMDVEARHRALRHSVEDFGTMAPSSGGR
jgi:hypothetical protein